MLPCHSALLGLPAGQPALPSATVLGPGPWLPFAVYDLPPVVTPGE